MVGTDEKLAPHGSRTRDNQHTTMRDVTPDGERDDAALFQMGQPKGELLNRFCDHHELLEATKHEREHTANQNVFHKIVSARFSHES